MIKPLPAPVFFFVVETSFSPFIMYWWNAASGPRIRRITLCGRKSPDAFLRTGRPRPEKRSCPELDELGRTLQRFLRGEDVPFDLDRVALEACAPFQQKVLLAEFAIPRGRVSTYGRIAAHIGAPGAARAVGGALAGNPFPIVIPCHRAVRADGSVGGYQGGGAMKRKLLEMEGVRFTREGKAPPELMQY